jgi:hypothetical protein
LLFPLLGTNILLNTLFFPSERVDKGMNEKRKRRNKQSEKKRVAEVRKNKE